MTNISRKKFSFKYILCITLTSLIHVKNQWEIKAYCTNPRNIQKIMEKGKQHGKTIMAGNKL